MRHIRSQNGNLLESIEDNGRAYGISASEKLTGARAETLPLNEWDNTLIERVGQVVGRCHAIAQTYTPSHHVVRRPQWDEAPNCFNPVDELATVDAFVIEKRTEILQALQSLPIEGQGWGLAHMDIHFANFIVNLQTRDVVLIDFDDCAYGWYIMDVAMLLFDLVVVYKDEPRKQLHDRFLQAFLKGYQSEKALSDFWIAQLPAFLKLLEIGIYAMLVEEYDPMTCADYWVNTFMTNREQRIREGVPYLD